MRSELGKEKKRPGEAPTPPSCDLPALQHAIQNISCGSIASFSGDKGALLHQSSFCTFSWPRRSDFPTAEEGAGFVFWLVSAPSGVHGSVLRKHVGRGGELERRLWSYEKGPGCWLSSFASLGKQPPKKSFLCWVGKSCPVFKF